MVSFSSLELLKADWFEVEYDVDGGVGRGSVEDGWRKLLGSRRKAMIDRKTWTIEEI